MHIQKACKRWKTPAIAQIYFNEIHSDPEIADYVFVVGFSEGVFAHSGCD